MSHSQLLDVAASIVDACRSQADIETQKRWGQYFTGSKIAAFMASLLPPPTRRCVRVLDPGAGTGILGVAAAEYLIRRHGVHVHLVSVEPEPFARKRLEETLRQASNQLAPAFTAEVLDADFLTLAEPLLGTEPLEAFDFAISNPPYFKLSPSDRRGGDAPNIYARFMEVTASLLRPGGALCFIIPRSFSSGYYFRKFRRRFHSLMALQRAHLFESRRDAFKSDGVLQENLVALYAKAKARGPVTISVSQGELDLHELWSHDVSRDRVMSNDDRRSVLFLPTCSEDIRVMETFESWSDTLASHQLEVSTGPVVPFRATAHLERNPGEGKVPLLWLQHVRANSVTWPIEGRFRKAEYVRSDAPAKLLVPNDTYVLMRRFSAKEEARRLVAAPLLAGQLPGKFIGLENHLNYIYRPRGRVLRQEAIALSFLLNSSLYDNYFRISSGNTQVSATELRAMPLPPPGRMVDFANLLRAREERSNNLHAAAHP